jgi:hypothetical protein
MKKLTVYQYLNNRFGTRYYRGASVCGRFEAREYDGQLYVAYIPEPGLTTQPDQEALYRFQIKAERLLLDGEVVVYL